MKRHALALLLTPALVAAALSPAASAQAPGPPGRQGGRTEDATKPARAERAELLSRLLGLLYSTAQDSKKWGDHVAAARVQAQVADLTWEADDATARAHLVQAWETTRLIKEGGAPAAGFGESKRAETRREVLLIARRRDPELASAWLADMTEEVGERRADARRQDFEDRTERSAVLLRMAAGLAESDPQAAADLAVESLRDGVSFGLQHVLLTLHAKAPELAWRVFRAAVARLRAAGRAEPSELLILHSYLYTPGFIIGSSRTEQEGSFTLAVTADRPAIGTPATLDPAQARAFLKLAADILLAAPPPSTAFDPQAAARAQVGVIQVLLGHLAGQFPAEAALLRARVAQLAGDARFKPEPVAPEAEGGPALAADTVQEATGRYLSSLEERAERTADPLARDQLYATAALAAGAAAYERSLSLAQKIGDSKLRLNLRSVIMYRAALHFAAAGDLEKAYAVNAENDDPLHRASCLVVCAQRLVKVGKTATADQWLREASELVGKADDGEGPARVLLGVTAVYLKFDVDSALGALSRAVKYMNGASVMPADERAPLTRRFSGLPFGDFTYDTTGFGLDSVISATGSEAFERVLTALDEISAVEKRGLAVVLLCRRHLRRLCCENR